jgi:hypothetical protein
MAGRKEALEHEVIPAWLAFLRGLLQGPQARNKLAEGLADLRRPTRDDAWHASLPAIKARVRHMTQLGSTYYPSPIKAWEIAWALRERVGHRFCAGPLVLFAAGHFVEFISVMFFADLAPEVKEPLLTGLVEAIDSANAFVEPLPKNADPEYRSVAYAQARIEDPLALDAREMWFDLSLPSHREHDAKFESAWQMTVDGHKIADDLHLDIAMLAATNADAPLLKRRKVVVEGLQQYFDRLYAHNEEAAGRPRPIGPPRLKQDGHLRPTPSGLSNRP